MNVYLVKQVLLFALICRTVSICHLYVLYYILMGFICSVLFSVLFYIGTDQEREGRGWARRRGGRERGSSQEGNNVSLNKKVE